MYMLCNIHIIYMYADIICSQYQWPLKPLVHVFTVCVCVHLWACVCELVCACACMCVGACVCKFSVCVCVCLCVACSRYNSWIDSRMHESHWVLGCFRATIVIMFT